MFNNEVYMKTSAEVCSQVASYFDIVDNCIAVSDTNKLYTINPQTSYSPSPPIQSGSYTSVIISPNTHNTADIYNGFIKADMKVWVEMDSQLSKAMTNINRGNDFNLMWFGFKDARDAIEKYEIVANGITVYTQNNACEESFLTACCSNEVTKKADVYSKARHKDVWDNDFGSRCGFTIALNEQKTSYYGTIHLKIDLRRFLPLSNIKYLPAFAGKIELRLYFSCAGMVHCPKAGDLNLRRNIRRYSEFLIEDVTNEFTPIGETIKIYDGFNDETKLVKESNNESNIKLSCFMIEAKEHTFKVNDYKILECSSIIPCFGIDNNVYNRLVQRYSNPEHPLTFPTQTLSFYTCTRPLKDVQDKCTVTCTPRFVDSIFCLFPLKHTHHTYFKNPLFDSFQLNCGGYGNIPAKPFGTKGAHPEFLEYCQNAMNMNGEQTGFNKEVIKSLCNNKAYNEEITGSYSNDRTSFFIGFATETDGTFQQGLTSLSPINFEMICTQAADNKFAQDVNTPPLLYLLSDICISILVQPNGIPPSVRIGPYDLTTPE